MGLPSLIHLHQSLCKAWGVEMCQQIVHKMIIYRLVEQADYNTIKKLYMHISQENHSPSKQHLTSCNTIIRIDSTIIVRMLTHLQGVLPPLSLCSMHRQAIALVSSHLPLSSPKRKITFSLQSKMQCHSLQWMYK